MYSRPDKYYIITIYIYIYITYTIWDGKLELTTAENTHTHQKKNLYNLLKVRKLNAVWMWHDLIAMGHRRGMWLLDCLGFRCRT